MRNEDTDRSGSGWASTHAGHITPADVQQKQFRTARLGGGYRMREVDEFLDQLTDALSSLIAENERLRREHTGGIASPVAPAPALLATAADRGAIDAFLRREKGFLQSLGSLVQGHAEDLKGMVRAARNSAPAPVTAVAPTPASPPASMEPDAAEATAEPAAAAATTWAEEASSAVPLATPEEASLPEEDDGENGELEEASRSTGTHDAEDPIRVEEPEPARSQRADGGSEASLRELFWGEE